MSSVNSSGWHLRPNRIVRRHTHGSSPSPSPSPSRRWSSSPPPRPRFFRCSTTILGSFTTFLSVVVLPRLTTTKGLPLTTSRWHAPPHGKNNGRLLATKPEDVMLRRRRSGTRRRVREERKVDMALNMASRSSRRPCARARRRLRVQWSDGFLE